MLKRPRQSDNRFASDKRQRVNRALEVQCPFRVHAREHALNYPEDHCEEGQTFKGNERLNEHLDRYHSLRYWCPVCKERFPFQSRVGLAALQEGHKSCTKRPQPEHEEEFARYVIMTKKQYDGWISKNWKKKAVSERKGETVAMNSWRKIYSCLFEEEVEFPSPCYPTSVEPMSLRPASSLPSPHNSDFDASFRRHLSQRQPIYTVAPIPGSESRRRLGAQDHGDDTGSALNSSPGQHPRNTSLSPEAALLPGHIDRSKVPQSQGHQRALVQSGNPSSRPYRPADPPSWHPLPPSLSRDASAFRRGASLTPAMAPPTNIYSARPAVLSGSEQPRSLDTDSLSPPERGRTRQRPRVVTERWRRPPKTPSTTSPLPRPRNPGDGDLAPAQASISALNNAPGSIPRATSHFRLDIELASCSPLQMIGPWTPSPILGASSSPSCGFASINSPKFQSMEPSIVTVGQTLSSIRSTSGTSPGPPSLPSCGPLVMADPRTRCIVSYYYNTRSDPIIICASKSLYRLMGMPLSIPTLVLDALKPFLMRFCADPSKQEVALLYSENQSAMAQESLRFLLTLLANKLHPHLGSGVSDDVIIEIIQEIARCDERWASKLLSSQEPDMCAIKEAIFAAAVRKRHYPLVHQLLEVGVNPDLPVIWSGVQCLRVNTQRILLDFSNHPESPHPALAFASLKGDRELADVLLRHRANVDSPYDYHCGVVRPLVLAAFNPDHKIALEFSRFILDQGAKVDAPCEPTPLMIALARGNDDLVTLLLDRGAEVDASYGGMRVPTRYLAQRFTALHVAILKENHGIFSRLIEDERVRRKCLEPDALVAACLAGQFAMASELIRCGANVNAESRLGLTPLTASAWDTTCQFPRMCLYAGASIERPFTSRHPEALHLAAGYGNRAFVELLINQDAKVSEERDGGTPLQFAIQRRQRDIFRLLADAGGIPTGGELVDAVLNEDDEMVTELLILGANILEISKGTGECRGESVLWAAGKTGNRAILLKYFAAGGQYESTALLAAVEHALETADYSIVDLLAESRSPGPIDHFEAEALTMSIFKMIPPIIRILLGKNFDPPNPHILDYSDCSPLSAALRSEPWVLEALLARGYTSCSVDYYAISQAIWSKFPLFTLPNCCIGRIMRFATISGDCEWVRKCLDAGAPVDSKTNLHAGTGTMLQFAMQQRQGQVARLLLDAGADVNSGPPQKQRTYWHGGATALQYAAMQGDLEIAQLLISKNADINTPSSHVNGRTALEGAAERGILDMVRLLLQQGADIQGRKRIQYIRSVAFATVHGHQAVTSILKRHGDWSQDDQEGLETMVSNKCRYLKKGSTQEDFDKAEFGSQRIQDVSDST